MFTAAATVVAVLMGLVLRAPSPGAGPGRRAEHGRRAACAALAGVVVLIGGLDAAAPMPAAAGVFAALLLSAAWLLALGALRPPRPGGQDDDDDFGRGDDGPRPDPPGPVDGEFPWFDQFERDLQAWQAGQREAVPV